MLVQGHKRAELGPEAKSFDSTFSATAAFSAGVMGHWLPELGKPAVVNKAQV